MLSCCRGKCCSPWSVLGYERPRLDTCRRQAFVLCLADTYPVGQVVPMLFSSAARAVVKYALGRISTVENVYGGTAGST